MTAVEELIHFIKNDRMQSTYTKEQILELLKFKLEKEKEQMIEFAKYTEFIDTDKSDMNKVIDFYLTLDEEEFVEETFKSE